MHFSFAAALVALAAVAEATTPPSYSGWTRKWSSDFAGAYGTLPSTSLWNIKQTSAVYNNEYQTYTKSTNNMMQSGSGTLRIAPKKDSKAVRGWTSARIESNYKFTPTNGRLTIIESSLRLGKNAAQYKQGIWPAFWLLGNSYRHGTKWPAAGELDIMENINGQTTAVGGIHCDKSPGGVCNEPIGIVKTVSGVQDGKYHRWQIQFNRRPTDWKKQEIQWKFEKTVFHKITGAQVGSETVWKTLCQSDLFIILNVAVGGDWPGAPNSATKTGLENGMEVQYVAHYVSNS